MNNINPGAIATVLDHTGSAQAIITNVTPSGEASGFIVRNQDYSEILRPWFGTSDEIIMVEDNQRGAVLDYPNVNKWVSITTTDNGGYFIRSSQNHGKRTRNISDALNAVVSSLFELSLNNEARMIKSNREMYITYLSDMVDQ